VVLAGDLKHSGKSFLKSVDLISNLLSNLSPGISPAYIVRSPVAHMLVDEEDTNVLSLLRELVERVLNLGLFRLLVYYQEVASSIGWFGDMPNAS
jgi:hypothetical protein